MNKYLIEDNGTLYTVASGALAVVSGTLSASLFQSDGFEDLNGVGSLMLELTAPVLHAWNSTSQPTVQASMIAMPYPQSIVTQPVNLVVNEIVSVDEINVAYTGRPLVALNFDGTGWVKYNGFSWVSASDGDGMDIVTLTTLTTEQWAALFSGKTTMQMRATLTDENDSITELQIVFLIQ